MLQPFYKSIVTCLAPARYSQLDPSQLSGFQAHAKNIIPGFVDGLTWSCALARHASGEVSFAVASSNTPIEDKSQVESGDFGTYVAVYDGHGGSQCSSFLNEHLLDCILQAASREPGGEVNEVAIRKGLEQAENRFLEVVRANWKTKPQLASVGSCVLLGFLTPSGTLHVASLGDSKAVLGATRNGIIACPDDCSDDDSGKGGAREGSGSGSGSGGSGHGGWSLRGGKGGGSITAVELSSEHNANNVEERAWVKRNHPGEDDIVVQRSNVWRVKGIIQVTRSIGDFYLKYPEFQQQPLVERFRLPLGSLVRPALSIEPGFTSRQITQSDRFAIFASDGLWEHMSPQEACNIVQSHPRLGIARRLLRVALFRAARARGITLTQLPQVDPAERRMVHDDISIIVLYFDNGGGGGIDKSKSVGSVPTLKQGWGWQKQKHSQEEEERGAALRASQSEDTPSSGSGASSPVSLSLKGLEEFKPSALRYRITREDVPERTLR